MWCGGVLFSQLSVHHSFVPGTSNSLQERVTGQEKEMSEAQEGVGRDKDKNLKIKRREGGW